MVTTEVLEKATETLNEKGFLNIPVDKKLDLVEEINQVGCELKDCSIGLIDYLSRHQGRDIYLCWKLGEERVNYWHELHSGFAGRQPVSVLQEDR